MQGIWKEKGENVIIINVYALGKMKKKRKLWEELKIRRFSSSINLWCLIGDFNYVRGQNERQCISEASYGTVETNEFNEFIEAMQVDDISLVGKKFTWFKPNGHASTHIDRVLVTKEWMTMWQGSS